MCKKGCCVIITDKYKIKNISGGVPLDEGSIPKLLLGFVMPAVLGMLAGAVYNIVDRVFVGQFVGPNGLAAISTSFPTMLMMIACSLLVGVGGASRVAILRGARKQRPAEQALTHSIMMLAVMGAAFIVLSFFGLDAALRLSGASEQVLPMARTYLRIILIGAPLALIGFGINSLIRACGSPRWAMATQMIGAVANVILDALFIYYMNMGVAGAAWGTVIAQGISSAAGLAFFIWGDSPLKIRMHFLLRPKFKVVKKICAVGSAPFLVEFSFVIYMTVMNQLIHKYGGDLALSALGVFFSLDSLLFLPAMAIGEAAQPIIGYNYGARKPERVISTIKWALAMVTVFYIFSFTVAEVFTESLISIFSTSAELLAIGVPAMRIGYIGLIFFGMPIVTNSALQGLGKARASLLLSMARQVLFMYAPLFVLPKYFGIWGVWMSFPVGDISGCLIAALFLKRLFSWLKGDSAIFRG